MWSTLEVITAGLALLLAFLGNKYSMPILLDAGVVGLGLTSIVIGLEAIITRRIVLGWRRRGNLETYTDLPAILQGIQFNLFGLFLIVVAIMIYKNMNGRALVLQMARHPGLPLIVFGMLCLMQSVITLIGPHELQNGPRWIVILNLLVSRLLPGIILIVIGLGMTGLGLFEIVAPAAFDQMGGGFLEQLYGLK